MALGATSGGSVSVSPSQVFEAIRSLDTRLEALQSLKHIVLGHDEQKVDFVRAGLVDTLLTILEEGLEDHRQTGTGSPTTLEVETAVVIILGSLARGGSSFLSGPQIEQLIPVLLDLLESPNPFAPLQEATLRTLNSVLSLPAIPQHVDVVSLVQSHPSTLRCLADVLNPTISNSEFAVYQATILLPKTCNPGDNRWQDAIVDSGILASLVKRLARLVKAIDISRAGKGNGLLRHDKSFMDRVGLSKSSSAVSLRYSHHLSKRGEPLGKSFDRLSGSDYVPIPPASYVAVLLDAIGFVVRDSKIRSDECLFARCITERLGEEMPQEPPRPPPVWRDSKLGDDPGGAGYHFAGQDFPPLSPISSRDAQGRAGVSGSALHSTANYPPEHNLDNEKPKAVNISNLRFAGETVRDPESPFINWLISYIRHEREPLSRLMAICLLTGFVQAGCVSKRNVQKIGLLVIPILVRYLDGTETSGRGIKKAYDLSFQAQETEWTIRERAPAILATLLTDNQRLQAAAVEADAIKRLAGMLKRAFEAIPTTPDDSGSTDGHETAWNERARAHQLKVREGTLRALAAIGLFEDEHRKKIIDSGALPFVVGSLTPEQSALKTHDEDSDIAMGGMHDTQQHPHGSQLPTISENDSAQTFAIPETSRSGNPVPVLIAATNVIRALSRSINVLSTSLIDWSVSEPLFTLLSHESIQVQISATAALCNLVMEFSPLRKGLQDKGIVAVLQRFAKYGDGNVCGYPSYGVPEGEFDRNKEELRLNATWALKHLILKQEDPVVKDCLSIFGSEWLLRQIAIIDQPLRSQDEREVRIEEAMNIFGGHDIAFSDSVLRRLATNYTPPMPEKLRQEALLNFQEQALDFFRNVMVSNEAADFFNGILEETEGVVVNPAFTDLDGTGPDEYVTSPNTLEHYRKPFYDVLTEKLRSNPGEKIVLAIIYVLVHIGACKEHIRVLVEQVELFQELVKLFELGDDSISVGLSWLVINVTWKENASSNADRTYRVQKLREYGFVEKLEMLKRGALQLANSDGDEGKGKTTYRGGDQSSSGYPSTSSDASSVRGVDGESTRSGGITMSLDLRERCRQALAQINDQ